MFGWIRELLTKRKEREEELRANREIIKLLKEEVDEKDLEIKTLKFENDELEKTLGDIKALENTTPSDCKPGEYCAACLFNKQYNIKLGYTWHVINVCNKAGSCENFVQKET